MDKKKSKMTTKDITLIGVMLAVIEACKLALMHIPNVELTSFFIIIFTIYFGKRIFFVIPAFILVESCMFGFGLWCIMYIYLWPMLAIVTLMFRESSSAVTFSIISGTFGLLFGLFASIPYVFVGSLGGNIRAGLSTAFSWWISGIPFDLIHGIANFLLMLVLYHPVTRVMKLIKK